MDTDVSDSYVVCVTHRAHRICIVAALEGWALVRLRYTMYDSASPVRYDAIYQYTRSLSPMRISMRVHCIGVGVRDRTHL